VERGGAYSHMIENGCHGITPGLDEIKYQVDTREFMIDVKKTTMFLKDNVSVLIDGVAYVKIKNVHDCLYEISDFLENVRQRCQASMRVTCGKLTLSELFSNRETMTENVQEALNEFFKENNKCAKLKRYEILDVQPTGIDLTKQIIAQKEKIGNLIDAEAKA